MKKLSMVLSVVVPPSGAEAPWIDGVGNFG